MSILKLQGETERRKGIYYEVDSDGTPIGVGGMGQVFRGRLVDESTGSTRPVAIKFLFDDLPADAIDKSRREASIQLQNDNLVEMLGFIETTGEMVLGMQQKHYHVVSELLWGVSLLDAMEGKTKDFEGNPVPFAVETMKEYRDNPMEFAKKIVHNVLLGLIALHNAGYIHRDIDPSNIMLTRDGKIKLIDFGIAKKFKDLNVNDVSKTKAGVFIGKPQYAAPELVLGDVSHQNQTTDIYAMGILLYQCITGKVPFEGDMASVLEQQQKKDVPLDLVRNKDLRAIIRKATQKKRENRYQSSAEMLVAIEHLSPALKEQHFDFKKMAIIAACVLGLGGAGVAAVSMLSSSDSDNVVVEAEQNSETETKEVTMEDRYDKAFAMLKDPTEAVKGFAQLKELSEVNHYEQATFLWSRLLFKSVEEGAYENPDYKLMRENANISINNVEAHKLLERAVSEDTEMTNAESRYQLALDFYDASRRDESYKELRTKENLMRAVDLLNEAITIVRDQPTVAESYTTLRNTIQSRIK
ncbi:MAG: serine/threonine protein kinase [Prevotella sp.]|nr:serine/threonine protein kinase [Prevotella sp.]